MFRLVRLAHLLLQGLTSLGGVGPESLDRPSGHLLFVPSCFFPDFAFFTQCVVFSFPFPCFPFLLFSCVVVPQGDLEHNAWDARSLLSRLSVPNISPGEQQRSITPCIRLCYNPSPCYNNNKLNNTCFL